MNEMKVSIVIPVYNAKDSIKKCIFSLINQTCTYYEIICVNDCSKDDSIRILNEIKNQYNNVVVIDNKKNMGASLARKVGISNAKGKYICFVDADDYVENNFIEKMVNGIESSNADIAECSYYYFFNNKQKINCLKRSKSILNKNDFNKEIIENTIVNGNEAIVMWNKIYKKELIDKYVKKYDWNILEDYMFNIQYYQSVNTYCYIDSPLIHYRIDYYSFSRTYNPNLYFDLKKIDKAKRNILKCSYNIDVCNNSGSSLWFCNYVYNYILNNMIVIKDTKLFYKICRDSQLLYHAKKSKSICLFSKIIAMNNSVIVFLFMLSMVPKSFIKKVISKLLYS